MSPVRALVALSFAAILAASADAEPLGREQLTALAEAGLSDDAILRLVETDGLAHPLTTSDVLALREAGLSASLVSRLVAFGAGDGIEVEERDGVTVITGRGIPEEEPELEAQDAGFDPPAATPAVSPAVVVVQGGSTAAAPALEPSASGYPAGAVFGVSGGAVFLPARFGAGEPSAFGRTIVGFGGTECCVPLLAPAPVILAPEPEPRLIRIRTSRGPLWVPN